MMETDTELAIERHREQLKQRFPLTPLQGPLKRRHSRSAAIVLMLLAAGALWWADPAYRSERLATSVGQQVTAALADGSRVVLNTGSKVDIAWHLRSRRVTLASGQALFDVAHSRWRPFTVAAGDTRVEVVGTMFDVWRQEDAVRVTVLRGLVKVSNGRATTLLRRNQQTSTGAGQLSLPAAVDAALQTAWKDGKLVFDRTPLQAALREMQRYHAMAIAPLDASLAGLRVSGVFDIRRAGAMPDLLPSILPVSVSRDENGVVHISQRGQAGQQNK